MTNISNDIFNKILFKQHRPMWKQINAISYIKILNNMENSIYTHLHILYDKYN